MRTIMISRGTVLGLALLATLGVAACTASQTPGNGPGNVQTTAPATSPASAPATSPAPAPPASRPAGTPSAAPTAPGGVRNLVIGSAERARLTAAFVAHKSISLSDVDGAGPLPGTAYYAYDPATDTYWALAEFRPSPTASLNVKVGFQDGENYGMFRKVGAGPWMVQSPGWPPICSTPRFFPRAVLMAWALPTSAPPGTGC